MAEPISDDDLDSVRETVDQRDVISQWWDLRPVSGDWTGFDVTVWTVASILARLDLAERRLAAVLAVVRERHERAKRAVETAAQLDDSETRISLRMAEAREGMAQSIRAEVEEAANG